MDSSNLYTIVYTVYVSLFQIVQALNTTVFATTKDHHTKFNNPLWSATTTPAPTSDDDSNKSDNYPFGIHFGLFPCIIVAIGIIALIRIKAQQIKRRQARGETVNCRTECACLFHKWSFSCAKETFSKLNCFKRNGSNSTAASTTPEATSTATTTTATAGASTSNTSTSNDLTTSHINMTERGILHNDPEERDTPDTTNSMGDQMNEEPPPSYSELFPATHKPDKDSDHLPTYEEVIRADTSV